MVIAVTGIRQLLAGISGYTARKCPEIHKKLNKKEKGIERNMQEKQLQELLGSLSLTEKIGQLVQVPGEVLNAEGQELGVREDLGLSEENHP